MSQTFLIRFYDPADGTSTYRETPVGYTQREVVRDLVKGQIDSRYDIEAIRCLDEAAGTFADVTREVLVAVAGSLLTSGEDAPASLHAAFARFGIRFSLERAA